MNYLAEYCMHLPWVTLLSLRLQTINVGVTRRHLSRTYPQVWLYQENRLGAIDRGTPVSP